eukprot:gb/GECH01013269.1/.p1 GENE.gb/GECH01013269.1/~~gb/GECH01013269.1/.p1  ORF type:complete len:506 (+),score=110.34 gb/GECH01013269.1/:1-1518(+)
MISHQHTYSPNLDIDDDYNNNNNNNDDDNLLSSYICIDHHSSPEHRNTLPISVCRHIFSFLSPVDVISLRSTCRAFDAAAQHRLLHIAADIVQSAASSRTHFRHEVATLGAMALIPAASISGTVTAATMLLYRLPWLIAPLAVPFTVSRSSGRLSSAAKALDITVAAVLVASTPAWLPHLPGVLAASMGVSATSVAACVFPAVVDNGDVFLNILRKRRLLHRAEKMQSMIAKFKEGKETDIRQELREEDDGVFIDKLSDKNNSNETALDNNDTNIESLNTSDSYDDVENIQEKDDDDSNDDSYERCEDEDANLSVSLCNVILEENGIFWWRRCNPPCYPDVVFTVQCRVIGVGEPTSYDPIRDRYYTIETIIGFPSAMSTSSTSTNTSVQDSRKMETRTFIADRKYSEFQRLYDQLCSDVSFFADVLPSFPPRSGIQGYVTPRQWSDDIITKRRRYFDRFLREITRPRNDVMLDTSLPEDNKPPPILDFLKIDMQWLWHHGVTVD